jgi:hypothetical protein
MARLRAEAEAADKADRLRVAQEQLAEYAVEKSQAASEAAQQVLQLDAALQAVLSGQGGGPDAAAAAAQLAQLRERLTEAAAEAQAFADQQNADVERLKRSSEQVGCTPVPAACAVPAARQLPVPPTTANRPAAAAAKPRGSRRHGVVT